MAINQTEVPLENNLDIILTVQTSKLEGDRNHVLRSLLRTNSETLSQGFLLDRVRTDGVVSYSALQFAVVNLFTLR